MAFVGAIPPAIGGARYEFLERRRRVASGQASRAYLEALSEIEQSIGPVILPPPASSGDDLETQLSRWEPLRARLAASASNHDELPGERMARFALARAVEANHDSSESPLAARMHHRMHNIGQFVSGLYCCFVEWDAEQGLWFDRCAVALSHSGLGVSPGFTADLRCSICDKDAADCEHLSDTLYEVTAARTVEGFCSICEQLACDHEAGRAYEVYPRSVFRNLEFQVSPASEKGPP